MIRIRRIDHVAIHVDDVARTASFYTEVLGCTRTAPVAAPSGRREALQAAVGTPAPTGGFWVDLPGSQIHAIKADRTSGIINPFGPHVAFEVEDFDEAKRDLDARALEYVEAPEGTPVRQLWLLDPSGNTIEIWARR